MDLYEWLSDATHQILMQSIELSLGYVDLFIRIRWLQNGEMLRLTQLRRSYMDSIYSIKHRQTSQTLSSKDWIW